MYPGADHRQGGEGRLRRCPPPGAPGPASVQNARGRGGGGIAAAEGELIAAAVFSAVLLYVSMGQMLPFGLPALPLPDLFSRHTHPMNFAVLQLLLAVPVLYCGR